MFALFVIFSSSPFFFYLLPLPPALCDVFCVQAPLGFFGFTELPNIETARLGVGQYGTGNKYVQQVVSICNTKFFVVFS